MHRRLWMMHKHQCSNTNGSSLSVPLLQAVFSVLAHSVFLKIAYKGDSAIPTLYLGKLKQNG